MRRSVSACAAIFAALFLASAASAAVVVDFSPDTTGLAVDASDYVNHVNAAGVQYLGDRFTLAAQTTITGGSIFSDQSVGVVGTLVRFMIFSDVLGLPGAPLFDLGAVLDSVDTTLTTSQAGLTRKHATIAPIVLAAGTYWFSMPGDGIEIYQAATVDPGYDDGDFTFSRTYPPAILDLPAAGEGDLFFTLEGNAATAAVPEPAALAIWGLSALGMAVAARLKRMTDRIVRDCCDERG